MFAGVDLFDAPLSDSTASVGFSEIERFERERLDGQRTLPDGTTTTTSIALLPDAARPWTATPTASPTGFPWRGRAGLAGGRWWRHKRGCDVPA